MKTWKLNEIGEIRILGRTDSQREPLTLFWTGSGLEFMFQGSELWIEIESNYCMFEPWYTILVNKEQMVRSNAQKGRYWICLFRGMNPDKVKHINFLKETQAMSDDPDCSLKIWGLKGSGKFLPLPEKKLKIEFIGDSITSGEGAVGAQQEEDWLPMFFSSVKNYTYMTSEALDAERRVISQSGWGILTGWDNDPSHSIPQYYEQICGLLYGKKNEEAGALKAYDFSQWQPDFVVINLGTNDASAFEQPAFIDPETKKIYDQKKSADGSYEEESVKRLHSAMISFLETIRSKNPQSKIIWAIGMIYTPIEQTIRKGIRLFEEKDPSGREKIEFVLLPEAQGENMGARTHPGAGNHKQAAEVLIKKIKEMM